MEKNNIVNSESFEEIKNKMVDLIIFLMSFLLIPLIIKIIIYANLQIINFRLIAQIFVVLSINVLNIKKKKIELQTKSTILFSLLLFAGFTAMYTHGVFSNGIFLLIVACIFTTIVSGKRKGFLFLGISFIIITLTAYGISFGFIELEADSLKEIFSPISLIPVLIQFIVFTGIIIAYIGKTLEYATTKM